MPTPVVVITGASSGIGRALARRFARAQWRLALAARNAKALEEVAHEARKAGADALAVATDVTRDADVAALADAVRAKWGAAHVVINNAGLGTWGPLAETTVADFDQTIATNLRGPFLVMKAFLPLLRAAEGNRAIVNVASVSGMSGTAGIGAYAASKFGLRGLTQSVAAELADEGIRVFAVNPGYVATPMVDDVPQERMIAPDDLAEWIWACVHAPATIQLEDVVAWPQRMYSE